MKRYDRSALVLDVAESAAARELPSRDVGLLHAADAEQAVLLAGAHREQIAALVLPGSLALDDLDLLLERLTPRLSVGRESVLMVAPPRVRKHLAGLRERGIRWVVWEPYDESELHFAVAATLASGDALEPREGLRVPIRLPVSLCHAGAERRGEILNLSVGGAYVALEDPPELGAALALEFPIGERLLCASARVAHRQPERDPERALPGPGMGLAFAPFAEVGARLLEGFVRERIDSFRL